MKILEVSLCTDLNIIPYKDTLKYHLVPITHVHAFMYKPKNYIYFKFRATSSTSLLSSHHFLIHRIVKFGLHLVQLSLLLIQQGLGLPQFCIGHSQAAFLLGQVCLRKKKWFTQSHISYETFMILVRKLSHKSQIILQWMLLPRSSVSVFATGEAGHLGGYFITFSPFNY